MRYVRYIDAGTLARLTLDSLFAQVAEYERSFDREDLLQWAHYGILQGILHRQANRVIESR